MARKINIRPTTSVYATYKNINYKIWTAIAEFVDNSTQSYYDNKKLLQSQKYWNGLRIEINYLQDESGDYYLEIVDNAAGMDFHDFQRAIVLDSKPKFSTRSEFGMGLKTAACWFGLKWSVETTQLGNNTKYYTEVDVEQLRKYKNEEIEVQETACNPKEHYTIIKIWDLNRAIKGRSVSKLKKTLAGMYRDDLRTGDINLYYNDEQLIFEEPEIYTETLSDGTNVLWKKDIDFVISNNGVNYPVTGMVAIRKKGSVSEAGFTLIRRGRVIIGGFDDNYRPEEIFGKSNSFEYQRIFGELHMDLWPVVQTKDSFDWYNGLEDLFIDKMKIECAELIKKSKKLKFRSISDIGDIIQKTATTFEKYGVINNVKVSDYEEQQIFYEQNSVIEDINDTKKKYETTEVEELLSNEEEIDIVLENTAAKKIEFEIAGTSYIFNLILEKENPNAKWLSVSRLGNEYTIKWNIKHVFFKRFMDDQNFVLAMQKFIFAFVISEAEALKTSDDGRIYPSSLRTRINDIIEEVCEVVETNG